MKKNDFVKRIQKFTPCSSGEDWIVGSCGQNTYNLYRICNRGDWLLWLAVRLEIDRKKIVEAACDCAEQTMKYVNDPQKRPQNAIRVARLWLLDKATLEEVKVAAAAAAAAYAAGAGARKKSLLKSAQIVRKVIPYKIFKEALENEKINYKTA